MIGKSLCTRICATLGCNVTHCLWMWTYTPAYAE